MASGPAGAQGASPPPPAAVPSVPTFAELEAAGARIGEIRVVTEDIFDLDDPEENNFLYRLANNLHIVTRTHVIRSLLLFETGEPLSLRVIEETERLLRANDYLYDVSIKPVAVRDGVADIEVKTRDTWSLDVGVSASREGGEDSGRLSLREKNLLGTGIAAGISYQSNVDRSGTTFEVSDNNVLGSRATVAYAYTNYDDGSGQSFSAARPFYALDSRWAAGVSASEYDVTDTLYNAGNEISKYGHRRRAAETFGGWSPGLVNGWSRRYSAGFAYQEDEYVLQPGEPPPVRLPSDLELAGPFVRFEVIQDAFRKDTNLNLIGRVEDFVMGVQSRLQLGRALESLGSTRDAWVYSANLSNGFDITQDSFLLSGASVSGRYAEKSENNLVGGAARYYHRRGRHLVYYAALSADAIFDPDVPSPLLLGGDNGLRGYPLRYQSGEKRVLFTAEARAYSDWYPFRLFRVGGAVFYDTGRAWGGENENLANSGWLRDFGFGLRLLSARTSKGNVLHADVAFPLDADSTIKRAQFLVKSKVSF